jgi:putative ABC transport system substrate-binding protein
MRRRRFAVTVASWAAALVGATARAQGRARVVVLLVAFDENAPAVRLFRDRLRSHGHIEGRTIDLQFLVAEGQSQLPRRAAEVVALRPDVVVALYPAVIDALRARTHAIPIVAVFCGDPVALGYSTNWARPTANVTGILDGLDTLSGKRIELLHELLPAAGAFGIVYEPSISIHRLVLERTQAASRTLGLALRSYPVDDLALLAQIPARAVADAVAALIVVPSPNIIENRAALIAAATASRMPTMHAYGFEVVDGAAVAYGTDQVENWQRAADYLSRLLRGEPLANLPFEENVRVQLTLNLATARTIGLNVPASIIARANEVIE